MIRVFGFLTLRSMKNRMLRRLRRLREPRYLVPTLVSVGWFVFWMGNAFLRGGHRPPGLWNAFAGVEVRDAIAVCGGLVLFVWTALLWLIPSGRAILEFTPPEIHFLFPAPVTRREIVHYKLLRAQLGILFGAFITAMFWGRGLAHLEGWSRLAGFWLLYATLHLHTMGAGFVRTELLDQGVSGLRRRLVPLALVLVFVGGATVGALQAWPALQQAAAGITSGPGGHVSRSGLAAFFVEIGRIGSTGLLGAMLAPFAVFPHVMLSSGPVDFLRWFATGFALLLLHYLWVIRSDTAFEEASVEAAQKRAARRATRRDAVRRGGRLTGRARPFPWRLAPTGRPATAILWKNLVSLTRVTPVRALVVLGAFTLAGLSWVMSRDVGGAPVALIVAVLCALAAVFTGMFGPIFVRNDLREDLFHVDIVKTFPLPGHAIVMGEVLGPWSVLAGLQVLLLGGATAAMAWAGTSSLARLGVEDIPAATWLFSGFASAILLLPAVTLAQITLQNALVLMFPAWVALGNSRARGFEASGQRMLTMFGSAFVLAVGTFPAVLSGGVATWLLVAPLGPVALPVGAAIAMGWIVAEVSFATRFLGRLLDRLDPSTAGIEAQDD